MKGRRSLWIVVALGASFLVFRPATRVAEAQRAATSARPQGRILWQYDTGG